MIPAKAKTLTANGMSAQLALHQAFNVFAGAIYRRTLAPGRAVLADSTTANRHSVGWRRVSDGHPCAFCAMLVTRGPIYGRDTAIRALDGTRYHDHCGCTAEEVFDQWKPTAQEQRWIDAYQAAAVEADTTDRVRMGPSKHNPGREHYDTIIWRMRRDGHGLFNDAHKPKTQAGTSGGGKPPQPPWLRGFSDAPKHEPYRDANGKPSRYRPVDIKGLDEAMDHILYGDVDKYGREHGGHLFAAVRSKMIESKIAFPERWSASDVKALCEAIINSSSTEIQVKGSSFLLLKREVDGVRVVIQVRLPKKGPLVLTAYPDGGRGVYRVHDGVLVLVP